MYDSLIIIPIFSPTALFNAERIKILAKIYQPLTKLPVDIMITSGKTAKGINPWPKHIMSAHYEYKQPLWIKEDLINLAMEQTIDKYTNIIWLDADIHFLNPKWLDQVLKKLEEYPVCQIWSECYEAETKLISYASNPSIGNCMEGLAWAARSCFLSKINLLPNINIFGGGDSFLATCIHGEVEILLNKYNYSLGYKEYWLNKQQTIRAILGSQYTLPRITNIAETYPTKMPHRNGGMARKTQLAEYKFNPFNDLYKTANGTIDLKRETENQIKLADNIKQYLVTREA